jgi:hypothetical protein
MRTLMCVGMALALWGCWQRNAKTCDQTHACVSSDLPYCDLNTFQCVAMPCGHSCTGGDMSGGTCPGGCSDLGAGDMTACASSADCATVADPICDATSHECRICETSTECAAKGGSGPLCSSSGQCVQCLGAMDCLSANQACDTTTGACVACTSNAACASGLCNAGTGACASPTSLVYVNAAGASCAGGGTGQGTLGDPYCALQKGLDQGAALSKTVVVFAGSYGAVSIAPASGASYTVSAVGIGAPVIMPTSAAPALSLTLGGGAGVNISLDGFTIEGATGATGYGVLCQGTSSTGLTKLKLVRSTVANNAQTAVSATTCDVTLDQDVIGPANAAGGLALLTSDFTLQNLLVVGNGTGGTSGSAVGGISITGTSSRANVVNNTVVNNSMKTNALAASGVGCGTGGTFINNVIVGNSGGTLQLDTTNCAPSYSSFATAGTNASHNQDLTTCGADAASIENAIFASPSGSDFHPKAGGAVPCTLVGLGTAAGAPAYDLDGSARPSVPAIGCLEAK